MTFGSILPAAGDCFASRHRLFSFAAVAFAALTLSSRAEAQGPPDIFHWSGNTALSQAQGFSMGSPLTLTWGFLRDGTLTTSFNGQTPASNFVAQFDATFGAGPGGNDFSQRPWYTHFANSFDRWSQLSGLSYVYENADDGANQTGNNRGILGTRADVRIGGRNIDGQSGILAFNSFPNNGDMVIDTADMALYGQSANSFRFLRNVVMHEHGHGIGCEHCESSNASFLMEPFINTSFDGPQYHDILLAQRGYGDRLEKSNGGLGNDTSANATSLGLLNMGGSFSLGNDARNLPVGATEVDFVSIDDQTDTDVFSFSIGQAGTVNALLESLGQTYQVGPQGGTQGAFNTAQRSDMTLTLLGSDGTTALFTSNVSSFGGNESLSFFLANAGTYYLRVTGVDNGDSFFDTQFYGLSVNAVPEPATLTALGLAVLALSRRRSRK